MAPPRPGIAQRSAEFEVARELRGAWRDGHPRSVDPSLNRHVAIKGAGPGPGQRRLTPWSSARPCSVAAVHHENVVTIHAVTETGGLPCLVMEYVAGGVAPGLPGSARPTGHRGRLAPGGAGGGGTGGGPAARAGPSRHQAGQPVAGQRERRPGDAGRVQGEDHRLRVGPDTRRGPPDEERHPGGHAGVHVPEQANCEEVGGGATRSAWGACSTPCVPGSGPSAPAPADGDAAGERKGTAAAPTVGPDAAGLAGQAIAALHAKRPEQRFPSAAELTELFAGTWRTSKRSVSAAGHCAAVARTSEAASSWPCAGWGRPGCGAGADGGRPVAAGRAWASPAYRRRAWYSKGTNGRWPWWRSRRMGRPWPRGRRSDGAVVVGARWATDREVGPQERRSGAGVRAGRSPGDGERWREGPTVAPGDIARRARGLSARRHAGWPSPPMESDRGRRDEQER